MVGWVLPVLCACGGGAESSVATAREPIIYAADGRSEYFEERSEQVRGALTEAVAVIARRGQIVGSADGGATAAQTLAEANELCPGERFAEQPAAAFCSAVLVDWDLVLTSAHCVRALPLSELEVVFGFYYREPGELDVALEDIFDVVEIVDEAKSDSDVVPRLDYAWLRLNRRVLSPRRPVPISLKPRVRSGQSLVAVGASGGVPLKIDTGGTAHDARTEVFDYFVADTDTSHGASGGGAFTTEMALLGVLARGGPDVVETEAGCKVAFHEDPELAEEEFTYAARARSELCSKQPQASSLCRADCEDICRALPPATIRDSDGCSIAHDLGSSSRSSCWLAVLGSMTLLRRWRALRARARARLHESVG